MPSVFKRPGSPYWYIGYVVGGKRVRESTSIHHCGAAKPPKQSPIWAHLRQVEETLFCQMHGLPQAIEQKAISDFLDEYMRGFIKHRQASVDRYQCLVKLFKQWCADNDVAIVADLTSAKGAAFIAWRRSTVSGTTLALEAGWLRSLMVEAKRLNYCAFEDNPFKAKVRKEKSKRVPFTNEEVQNILAAEMPDWLRTAIMIALYTGGRIDSIKHLRWEHVVWPVAEGSYGHMLFAKTKTTAFKVALHPTLLAHLLPLRKPSGLVLPAAIHERCAGYISGVFKALLRTLGIAGKSFHCFRHTVATRLQACGVDKRIGMAILHHQTEAIHEAYSHADAEAFGSQLAKLSYE